MLRAEFTSGEPIVTQSGPAAASVRCRRHLAQRPCGRQRGSMSTLRLLLLQAVGVFAGFFGMKLSLLGHAVMSSAAICAITLALTLGLFELLDRREARAMLEGSGDGHD